MKIITLTAFILLTTLGIAQTSSLTIFNNNGQQFFVIMNGIRQNSLPQTNVKISGMNNGAYEVKLIFADGKTGDINKKIFLDTVADFQARVVFKGKKGKLQYYGMTGTGSPAPSGGSTIIYRPTDQSVYSDQQSSTQSTTGGGQGTVQQGGTQTYGGQTSGTVQQGGSAQTQSGTTSSQGQFGGQGSMTTSTSVSDPSMSGSGSGSMTTTTTVSDPSLGGSGTVGMTTSTSVSDPSMGGTGTVGMTTTTTVSDPTMNGGTGGIGTTMTVTDPNNPNGTININVNMNMSDPNLNGGQGTYGTTTTVTDGQDSFGTTTTTDGTGMTTTTTTSSSSSTTTTTTSGTTTMTQNGTWGGNSQQGTITYGDEKHGGEIVSTNGTQSSGYSCTTIMTDVDGVVKKIKAMSFDSDKREYIEKELKATCVTADQAYKIVGALTFAEDRLDMSKFFYDRMTDKVNGKRLLELLTFEMDQDEFTTYMSTH